VLTPLTVDELDTDQAAAVALIFEAAFGILTGGPGTGKTSCLRIALDMMDASHIRYALAAPTGKAARRMADACGRSASTLHRLLGFRPGVGFTANRQQPITVDVVIVDEASMLDVELAAALFRARGEARVILVGDADQLPPVGPGQVFADLVASDLVPTVRLRTLHRSAREAWISQNAPVVLAGKMPDLADRPDFHYVRVRSSAGVLPAVRRTMEDVDMQAKAQLLIPMREGVAGTTEANVVLQTILNPEAVLRPEPAASITRDRHHIQIGDRVIQTRNNYDLAIFNGEVGTVMDADASGVVVQFPESTVTYKRNGDERALELAYALTVHKSQGSEFPWVVAVVHSSHTIMLNRRLFYTAITRAKQGVIIVGDDAGLERAIGTGFVKTRLTTLVERLTGTLDAVVSP
jgi:exodeoxyribonuclease V alpha subunit